MLKEKLTAVMGSSPILVQFLDWHAPSEYWMVAVVLWPKLEGKGPWKGNSGLNFGPICRVAEYELVGGWYCGPAQPVATVYRGQPLVGN